MPLREYLCKKCNHGPFEKLVFGDLEEQAVRCPKCGGEVKILLSKSNIEIHGYNADNGYSRKKE